MNFCENIVEVGSLIHLRSIFAQNFNIYKVVIIGIEFNVSVDIISLATSIPNHGDTWFKGMELHLHDYKILLKPNVREIYKQVLPFKHLLNRYARPMKLIMKYFTCEGKLSRLYKYHVRLLIHFTSVRTLNLWNFLFRSVLKMTKNIHTGGQPHITNLFHRSLIKILVMHQLSTKKITWETFMDKIKTAPGISPTVSPSKTTPSGTMPTRPMEHGSTRKNAEVSEAPRPKVTKKYQRGNMHMFSPQIVEGAKPSTSPQ